MHRPVIVNPATDPVVTLDEIKQQCRIDADEDDSLLEGYVAAAVRHLEGWGGIIGQCLGEQTIRQDFDCFERHLSLPLGPVIAVDSITWRDSESLTSTVGADDYEHLIDAGGRDYIRFGDSYSLPIDVDEQAGISVTYSAGHPLQDGISQVPAPIKVAIMMLAAHWYENREASVVGVSVTGLPMAVTALISPYRKVSI